jgi:O-antigen ligase
VLALFVWSVLWAALVPLLTGMQFEFVWAEADAILMLLPISLSLVVYGDMASFVRIRRIIVGLALVLAALQLAIWLVGTLRPEEATRLRSLLTGFYETESVYVGPMPDGTFRVFWISTLWCMLAFFWVPLAVHRRRWRALGYILLVGSFVASYSRGLWLAVPIGVAVALSIRHWRRPGRLGAASALLVLAAIAATQIGFVATRFDSDARDLSLSERREQIGPLVDLWMVHPWFGTGYGGFPGAGGSVEAPFSFEMVPLALLMKMGVVGITGLVLFWGVVFVSAISARAKNPAEVAAFTGGCVALLLFASTNPLFLNFVGMAVFGCLMLHVVAIHSTVNDAGS